MDEDARPRQITLVAITVAECEANRPIETKAPAAARMIPKHNDSRLVP